MDLITNLNLSAPDDFYAALVESHKGLSIDESNALNARLILILANHVGTQTVLIEALEAAREAVHP
jgi:hypothetical protein